MGVLIWLPRSKAKAVSLIRVKEAGTYKIVERYKTSHFSKLIKIDILGTST